MTDYLLEYRADSEEKLAPLFDIVELATEVFGIEKDAANALGLSHQKFKDARRVMNDSSVRLGRHRGQELGPQRDATASEIALCESVTETIVREYTELVRKGVAPR
jgi:hypothetical protein